MKVIGFVAGTALAVSGCAAHTEAKTARVRTSPVSVGQVQSAFRSEGIPLLVTLDFRTLDERKIVELTRPKLRDAGAQRAAKRNVRAYLEFFRRGGRGARPVMWLHDRKGLVSLVVWRRAADAQGQVGTARRFAPPGLPLPIVAVRNVVVVTSGDARMPAKLRVSRAISRLRRD